LFAPIVVQAPAQYPAGMGVNIAWFRGSLMTALGLVACGPGPAGSSQDGSGSSLPGETTVVDPTGVTPTTSGTTSPTLPDPPWCGVSPPDGLPPPPACESPTPILQQGPDGDVPSGMILCSNGWRHRESQVTCLYPPQLAGSCNSGDTGGDESSFPGECNSDADCTAMPHGYCNQDPFFGTCVCAYGCESDADCDTGQACVCRGTGSACVTAHCATDADCGEFACQLSDDVLACRGPFDTCLSGAECTGDCPVCEYSPTDCAYSCEPDGGTCTVGRPFLVQGAARTADAVAHGDWDVELGRLEDAPPALRDRLARHWTLVGLAEHASVPAFARFALQLAALGAPARLLADTARAIGDEVEHARIAFTLARRHGGVAVGPGPLAMDGAFDPRVELVAVVELALVEACVGETLAAIEAAEAAEAAEDPALHSLLARIAADELRHAELGWRFVAWALPRIHAPDRDHLRRTLDTAIHHASTLVGDPDPALHRHGVLDGPTRHRTRTAALRGVVRPIAEILFQPLDPHAAAPIDR
jgi:hypothetical protein